MRICQGNTKSFLESHSPHLANTEKCSPNTGIVLSVFQRSSFRVLLTTYLTTEETEAQRGQALRQNQQSGAVEEQGAQPRLGHPLGSRLGVRRQCCLSLE